MSSIMQTELEHHQPISFFPTIETFKRSDNYVARLVSDKGAWEAGATRLEALGNLYITLSSRKSTLQLAGHKLDFVCHGYSWIVYDCRLCRVRAFIGVDAETGKNNIAGSLWQELGWWEAKELEAFGGSIPKCKAAGG